MRTVGLIAVGGAVGALLRWAVDRAFPTAGRDDWPLSTLFINVTGSALLALILVTTRRSWIRPLVGTGLLGGFTTFSLVMSQVGRLTIDDGNLLVNSVYLGMTLFFSVSAVALIFRVFRR